MVTIVVDSSFRYIITMYLTPKQKRKNTITIIVLVLGIPLTVFAAWQAVQIISRASIEPIPKDIIVSNVSTSSVSIGWFTDVSADGAVSVVKNGIDSSPVIDKRGTERRENHYVELSGLEPNSEYTFVIISGGERYDNDEGKKLSFVTAPISSSVPSPNPVYGDGGNFSKDNFIVYIINKSQSSFPVSVVPNASGGWAADLSGFRRGSDLSIISIEDSDELKLIVISGVSEGDIVEGTFTELFDSKGKLRLINSFNPEENTVIMSSFTSYDVSTLDEAETIESDTDTEEIVNSDNKFRIVHDLNWIDMVQAGENLNLVTGEDSILITNLRDTGFEIIWLSENEEEGYIMYGTSPSALELTAKDIRDSLTVKSRYRVHNIEVENLNPETTYYFDIHSGSDVYEGYDVTTFEILSSAPPIGSISGNITNIPSEDGVVVVGRILDQDNQGTSGDSEYASTLSDSRGGWILPIADIRNVSGSAYFSYTDADVIELSVICYGESTTKQESIADIESRDIELEITENSNTIRYTKVPLLENYSVLGIRTFSPAVTNDKVEEMQNVLGVESVPNTGILDSIFGKIFLGIGCVILGLGVWKSISKKKKVKKLSP